MKTAIFILQIFCILVTSAGIYIEYLYEAHMGFLLISVGSFTFAVTTKFMKIRLKRYIKKLLNEQNTPKDERSI
ncbi:unnamed protein product [marine sediment metagenome]|uniref:Uncharacterized protein n=1 Tax=marine sediment metagenome TaxID=412755 RepID=X1DBR3_9ZZZZ